MRNGEPMDVAAPLIIPSPPRNSKESDLLLDELLRKIKNGFNVKDAKMSDVLAAYERKILNLERRERELELLVSAKDQAILQSEKLRVQFRGGNNNETEMSRIRSLVADCETLREKVELTNKELKLTRQLLDEKTAALQADLEQVKQERDDLAVENGQERELVLAANRLTDDLKKKLELTSSALVERQNEVTTLNREKASLTDSLNKANSELSALQQLHATEVKRLNADVILRNDTIDKLSREAEAMQTKLQAKEQECENYMKELDSVRCHDQKTQADLERMRKLRDEMRKLTEGFD
ncbi:unnamed protein product [Cylicostephanus goldi]|uniref:Uncharacterized protein n=1 Tax=Cylicostephanus goldi TaxID=71465 RepID=A0A3P7MFJ5_CYLGO|nr:unnamed protein product [Cylicostephanus goldi]